MAGHDRTNLEGEKNATGPPGDPGPAPQVTINILPPGIGLPTLDIGGQENLEGQFPHTVFDFQSVYYTNTGKLQLPVSGPTGTKAKIVDLHAAVGVRVVIWLAVRKGRLPELPDPETANENEVLADVMIGTAEPKMLDGIRYEYGVSGKFTYLCYAAPDKSTGFPMGTSVISTVRAGNNVITANNFTKRTQGE